MPRIKRHKTKLQRHIKGDWQTELSRRTMKGEVIPVISNSLGNDLVLGGHQELVKSYAEDLTVSEDQFNLPYLVQIRQFMDYDMVDADLLARDYLNFVKNKLFDLAETGNTPKTILEEVEEAFDDLSFSEFSERLGYPKFNKMQQHPLRVLARLDIPIYITTCYHDFIEKALRLEGKKPKTEICRWHHGLEETISSPLESGFEPSEFEPLVYHLHGLDEYPQSLVLTEDDHLQFLVNVAQNEGNNSTQAIHSVIRSSMRQSMILLGYDLRQWEFRTLFWGLIKNLTRESLGVSLQIEKSESEKAYIQRYLKKYKFKVFWGDIYKYVTQLQERGGA